MQAANQNREAITKFADISLHRWWKKYSSDRFVVIFSVFILSMPFKVIIIVIEFMFLGINIFWALLIAHFNPRLTARAKMNLSRAQNIFMPATINSIVLLFFQWSVMHSYCSLSTYARKGNVFYPFIDWKKTKKIAPSTFEKSCSSESVECVTLKEIIVW